MEQLLNILHYLKEHPEVTWSGAGLTALGVLYFLITKLLAPLFRKGIGHDEKVSVKQTVKGNNNIAAGSGGVAVGGNIQGNVFTHSGSGDQNIAQGNNAIGKQVNTYTSDDKERRDEEER